MGKDSEVNGKDWSTSLMLARDFNIAHNHLLAKIRKLISSNKEFDNDFIEDIYINTRGKKYPIYRFSEKGRNMMIGSIRGVKNIPDKLYIIKSGEYYKIGISNDIVKRIKAISNNLPHDIYVVCYYLFSNAYSSYKAETYLHKVFKDYLIRSEWFSLPAGWEIIVSPIAVIYDGILFNSFSKEVIEINKIFS